jgi:predicted membrane GTPase involved in stress response
VQGRGELQLAVLVEQMRREGFELTVGKPQVVTRRIDGILQEPVARVSIDVPEEYLGVVTQLFALRKGRTEALVNHGTGWVRMDVVVPARGLIGFRTEFLTETRGTGIMHHAFERLRAVGRGAAHASDRSARGRPSRQDERLRDPQPPGARRAVRRAGGGGLRGDDRRREPAGRRPRRERDQGEEAEEHALLDRRRARPAHSPARLSLDQALEYIREDECVEVVPHTVRLRKVELSAQKRQSAASRKARGLAPA